MYGRGERGRNMGGGRAHGVPGRGLSRGVVLSMGFYGL